MKVKNTKKVLKNRTKPAMILARKVAGFVVQQLKTFWQNWQWAIALVALLYGIFLFYYQSSTSVPARIEALENKVDEHISVSDKRMAKIESDYSDVKISLAEIKAMVGMSLQDLGYMKNYITGEAHHK